MNPFAKTVVAEDSRSIRFYGKKGATWEQMNAWMESNWSDPAYKWCGFGKAGEEDFIVVLTRRYEPEVEDSDDEDEDEDEGEYTCGLCEQEQDKEYSICCEACGLLTCEDCLKSGSSRFVCYRCEPPLDNDDYKLCENCCEIHHYADKCRSLVY